MIPKRRKNEPWREYISRLISFFVDEGYPRKQAVAIALSYARKKGMRIYPKPKK